MVVARLSDGHVTIIDRLREMVRLASGLDSKGRLDEASRARALDCLARFGQRLAGLPPDAVRVVGTNTLRRARRAGDFFSDAEKLLGHSIEVISGFEEARLIYQGVSHGLPVGSEPMLVIDIGGGSTELIAGEGFEPVRMESLFMGCVGTSRSFFADGKLDGKRFKRARLAIRLELRPVEEFFRGFEEQRVVGSSGTIRAAAKVANALGLSESGVSRDALAEIIARLVAAKRLSRLELPGLSEERKPVFAGGVAILDATMEALGLTRIETSDWSLREGLLYDIAGRFVEQDPRDRTVAALCNRYGIDADQAARVRNTAARLLELGAKSWRLTEPVHKRALRWAADLHEIGLGISHVKYHEHGAYLLSNSDLPGFGQLEQRLVATLVGYHRRKMNAFDLSGLPRRSRRSALRLIVLLRLAVLLNRSRRATQVAPLDLVVKGKNIELRFPRDWLESKPLTMADLEQEAIYLSDIKINLSVSAT